MINLASLGDEAKIWDVPTFALLEQFNPFTTSLISDLTWSHDGNSIAACSSTEKTVYVRLTKTSQSIPSESIVLPAGCQCLDFNSLSRFLLCGCVDGSVHIWDRKTKAIKKTFGNLKHPVTVARWNWNDTYISVGLENGNILLYNVATSHASSPLVAPSVKTIRQLKYNPYQKSSLVSVSEDSAVNFWDTNTRRLVHAFRETHQAPARDLAFSPINDFLMVSVGLDKRAVFYDVQNKKPVKTVVAEQPLTCVDMMQDGATVVVGTTRGNIFFYDMRQPTAPVFSFTAHKSSVKRLSFVRKDSEKSGLSSTSSSSSHRQLPVTPTSIHASNQNTNNSNYQSPRTTASSTGLDIFSPIGNANKSSNSVAEKTGSEFSWMHNLSRSHAGDIFTAGDGVYSPVRHDNSQSMNSTHNRSSILSNNSFLTQVLGSVDHVNKDPGSTLNTNLYTIGEATGERILPAAINGASSLPEKDISKSPPRLLPQRSIGASPSLQQLSSPAGDDIDPASIVRSSPEFRHRASPRSVAALPSASSLPRHGVTFGDQPDILSALSINGTASGEHERLRSEFTDLPSPLAVRNGPASLSSSRSPTLAHHHRPSNDLTPPTSAAAPGTSTAATASSAASTVHLLVQDLLREQFQHHQEQLKSEIRAMLGQPGYPPPGASHTSSSTNPSLANHGTPGIFQAEFIRNLIREELDDVKDFIHKEFWCLQVEMIKQIFQLQKKMEAGFQECMINPILLDEIDRLREENARLKKTF